MSNDERPIKIFASGAVEASLWLKDQRGTGTGHDVEIRIGKCYRDSQGWHQSNRFSITDLPRVLLVVQEAYRYLALRELTPRRNYAAGQSVSARQEPVLPGANG